MDNEELTPLGIDIFRMGLEKLPYPTPQIAAILRNALKLDKTQNLIYGGLRKKSLDPTLKLALDNIYGHSSQCNESNSSSEPNSNSESNSSSASNSKLFSLDFSQYLKETPSKEILEDSVARTDYFRDTRQVYPSKVNFSEPIPGLFPLRDCNDKLADCSDATTFFFGYDSVHALQGTSNPLFVSARPADYYSQVLKYGLYNEQAINANLTRLLCNRFPKFIYDIEDIKQWGAYAWCLYGRLVAPGGRTIVAIPNSALARITDTFAPEELVRNRYLESVIYLPVSSSPNMRRDMRQALKEQTAVSILATGFTLIVTSENNESINFFDYRCEDNASCHTYSCIDYLQEPFNLSYETFCIRPNLPQWDSKLGDIVERVPPLFDRDVQDAYTEEVSLFNPRAIAEEYFDESRCSTKTVSERAAQTYRLKSGDLVFPRFQRGAGKRLYCFCAKGVSRSVVATTNYVVLRLKRDINPEVMPLLLFYLQEGYGAKLLEAKELTTLRWGDLAELPIPPVLDSRKPGHSSTLNLALDLFKIRASYENLLKETQFKLDIANADIDRLLGSGEKPEDQQG